MATSKIKKFDPYATVLPVGLSPICARSDGETRWLEARSDLKCTGSQVGALLGISPFTDSPDDEDPYGDKERRMYVGSLVEGVVLTDSAVRDKLEKHAPWAGGEVMWNEDDYLMATEDGLGSTPDGVVVADERIIGIVEVKFVSASWEGADPPSYYRAQAAMTAALCGVDDYALAAWQQGATGVMRPYTWFGKVSGGFQVRGKILSWDEVRDILTGKTPSPEPIPTGEGIAVADEALLSDIDELIRARAVQKDGNDRADAARNAILDRVGKAGVEIVNVAGDRVAEIVMSPRKSVPSSRLKEHYPEIWNELVVKTETCRINV